MPSTAESCGCKPPAAALSLAQPGTGCARSHPEPERHAPELTRRRIERIQHSPGETEGDMQQERIPQEGTLRTLSDLLDTSHSWNLLDPSCHLHICWFCCCVFIVRGAQQFLRSAVDAIPSISPPQVLVPKGLNLRVVTASWIYEMKMSAFVFLPCLPSPPPQMGCSITAAWLQATQAVSSAMFC